MGISHRPTQTHTNKFLKKVSGVGCQVAGIRFKVQRFRVPPEADQVSGVRCQNWQG